MGFVMLAILWKYKAFFNSQRLFILLHGEQNFPAINNSAHWLFSPITFQQFVAIVVECYLKTEKKY